MEGSQPATFSFTLDYIKGVIEFGLSDVAGYSNFSDEELDNMIRGFRNMEGRLFWAF